MASRRRDVLGVGAALLATPLCGFGQARKVRIGLLGGTTPDAMTRSNMVDPLVQGLRDLGRVEGTDFEMHSRWAEGEPERLPALAAELLKLQPDVLVAAGPRPALVAKGATTTVPIVALGVDNPVEMGLAADFARPGGNVTGVSAFSGEVVAKRLQLLKEIVPQIRRVAVLMNPATASRAVLEPLLHKFADSMGLAIQLVEARSPEQFGAAFEAMRRERCEGVLVLADATFWTHRARLHELVARDRLPSVWGGRGYLDGGGLASYQSDFPEIFRRGAVLVDRILKGASPAETPFEQATKLELAVNLRSAQALGIAIPQSLLISADHVIR